jgi:hypothetical protein
LSAAGPHRFDVMMLDDPWLPALIGEDLPDQPATRLDRLVFDDRV